MTTDPHHQAILRWLDTPQPSLLSRRSRQLWSAVNAELLPLVSASGFSSLYSRCLDICGIVYPWLEHPAPHTSPATRFDMLAAQLLARPPPEALAAIGALFSTFYLLLQQLIGSTLAAGVLDAAWRDRLQRPPLIGTRMRARRQKQVAVEGPNLREAARTKHGLQRQIVKLRQTNARLVTAILGAQVLTEEVQRAKDDMGHMVRHDFLTGLPNRLLLMERMGQAIALARRQGSRMALLFIDLDRFKAVNDTLGHAIGDLLLQAVAQRLLSVVRTSDTACRQGGDEFVVLLADVANERAVSDLAEKLCRALAEPYPLAGETAYIGATIGISMYPDDGEEAEALIRNADVAMYHGKQSGRNRCYFYRTEMNLRVIERQRTEADLHRALHRGEFELYYQPRINLASGAITGAEALLRWTHPEHGAVSPSRFIPVAEECGLIVQIGHWVLHETCMQAARWRQSGLDPGVIAVNISALEFRNDGFADTLRAALAASGLAPASLELEITESVLMHDATASAAILHELKDIGVVLAIDDFGTGYSSLSYLNRFPIDVLKIDRSFVHDINVSPGNGVIVGAVIAMGGTLGQRVVAGGVEEEAQLEFLRAHQCEEGQGYLFSRPLPAADFAALLKLNQ